MMLKKAYQLGMIACYVVDAVSRIELDSMRDGSTPGYIYRHAFAFSDRVLDFLGVDVEVEGLDNLVDGPAIICQNHTSLLDIPALLMFPGRKYFGTKKELFRIPIFGHGMHAVGMPMIDRSSRDQAYGSLTDAVQRMRDDPNPESYYLVMFPEGTRSRDYTMGDFRMGAFNLAAKADLPIVPVASYGAVEILPKKSLDITSGKICITILPALYPEDQSDQSALSLCSATRSSLERAISDLMKENSA